MTIPVDFSEQIPENETIDLKPYVMNRYIKDFRALEDKHMMLIKSQYPDGFSDHDVVALKTAQGNYFDCLEVRTDDAIYLVKVNHALLETFEDVEQSDEISKELEAEFLQGED